MQCYADPTSSMTSSTPSAMRHPEPWTLIDRYHQSSPQKSLGLSTVGQLECSASCLVAVWNLSNSIIRVLQPRRLARTKAKTTVTTQHFTTGSQSPSNQTQSNDPPLRTHRRNQNMVLPKSSKHYCQKTVFASNNARPGHFMPFLGYHAISDVTAYSGFFSI